MEQLTINLPDELKEFVHTQITGGNYSSPSAHFAELLEAARKKKTFDKVEGLIREGVNSGKSTPWTSEDVKEIRREIRERHGRDVERTMQLR